jgi:DNA repair ATPase RecN
MPFKVRVRNFQSIADATIDVEGFTVITGQNNSGKSALQRAIRGAFQNLRGTDFIRYGEDKSIVEITFNDGHSLLWEKGKSKGSKPTYIIDGGKPIYPGQSIPVEIETLGVSAIQTGGKEIWPQFAPQFTGQVFLIDQPGSTLAEAVSDVNRVTQLNQALKDAESDRRSAVSESKVRQADKERLEQELVKFTNLEQVIKAYEGLEKDQEHINKLKKTIEVLLVLKQRLETNKQLVEKLSGISDIVAPSELEVLNYLDIFDDLETLRGRLDKAKGIVAKLDGITGVPEITTEPIEKIYTTLNLLEGLQNRYNSSMQNITYLENECTRESKEADKAKQAVATYLQDIGQCPVCGADTTNHGVACA